MESNLLPSIFQIVMVDTPEGPLPQVESTELGAATKLLMVVEDHYTNISIGVATMDSVLKGKPKFKGYITRLPKRLVVGMFGQEPLIDHEFDSGRDMCYQGRPIHTTWIYGGIEIAIPAAFYVPPIMKVTFSDTNDSEELKLDYIKLECWPPTEANQKSPIWPPKELMFDDSAQTEEVISPIL